MTGTEHDDGGTGEPGSDGPGDGRANAPGTGPARPHENAVRALLSDPGRVLALIRDQLPNDIAGLLSDAPPAAIDGTFVDEALRGSQSDFLFEVQLKSGKSAFIFLLVEHKSRPDPATPLQLAGYMIRIWQRYGQGRAERLRALPPIVPMVLYNGRARWSAPEGIGGMIASTDPALVFLPGDRFVLRDLGALTVDDLSRDPALRSGFIVLTGRAMAHMETVVDGLRPEDPALQRQLMDYILSTYPDLDLESLMRALQAVRSGPLEAMVDTIAERLTQEGRMEGLREGEALGLEKGEARGQKKTAAQNLTRLLEHRFGPLSDEVAARIAAADAGLLERWFDTALDAPALSAVFGNESAH